MQNQKFYIVTDAEAANRGRTRLPTMHAAITEATNRVESGNAETVFIMECVKVVKRPKTPVVVEDIIAPPEPQPRKPRVEMEHCGD